MAKPGNKVYKFQLNEWDQTARRSYIPLVLCFDCDEEHRRKSPDPASVAAALEDALATLARQWPALAGTLTIDDSGREWVQWADNGRIPYKVTDLLNQAENTVTGQYGNLAGYSPEELRTKGYPQTAFTGTHFFPDGSLNRISGTPVFKVEVFLYGGTFLMNLLLHHGYADGAGMASVIRSFAEATRGTDPVCHLTKGLQIPPANHSQTGNPQWDDFPEYQLAQDKSGPTQAVVLSEITTTISDIPRAGKIFVIDNTRISTIKELVLKVINNWGSSRPIPWDFLRESSHEPGLKLQLEVEQAKAALGYEPVESISNYTMLAALTWAAVTEARSESEEYVAADVLRRHRDAVMLNPVNWKGRAPEYKALTENLFGNTTATALTAIDRDIVIGANHRHDCLAVLVQVITQTIGNIDANFVEKRTRLFESLEDPRELGLRWDTRLPTRLGFNTWRFMGGSEKHGFPCWTLPGVGKDVRPSAYRKGTASWGLGEALVLPTGEYYTKEAGREKDDYCELLIQLPVESMEKFLQSNYCSNFVERVID